MFVLQTLVLYECEKHPREEDWEEVGAYWKIIGIVLVWDWVLGGGGIILGRSLG